jgi:hypothetical protein
VRVAERAGIGNNQAVRHALLLAPGIAQNGFTFVVFGTVAFSLVISLLFLLTRGSDSMYDHIGQGGLTREGDGGAGAAAPPAHDSPAGRAEREEEVRQMLAARSERRVRRGEPPLDIDAEVTRLLAGPGSGGGQEDPALLAEVRELVVARNERRLRQGLEPLDVEAETARTLREMQP